MSNPLKLITNATKTVLTQGRVYWFLFLCFIALALILFVLVPVWSIPGNDVAFQLSLFTIGNWTLFVILALLIALLLTMQVFIFRRARNAAVKAKSLGSAAVGATGAYAGVLGGVFATAACSWCVAAVFGFLGTGTVLFIAQNQFWAVLVAISIMLVSLYFTSKKVVSACDCTPIKIKV
jgi:hypothetical protein